MRWKTLKAGSQEPPASDGHSLTLVGTNSLLFFGGQGKKLNNTLYCLDTETYTWRMVEASGVRFLLPLFDSSSNKYYVDSFPLRSVCPSRAVPRSPSLAVPCHTPPFLWPYHALPCKLHRCPCFCCTSPSLPLLHLARPLLAVLWSSSCFSWISASYLPPLSSPPRGCLLLFLSSFSFLFEPISFTSGAGSPCFKDRAVSAMTIFKQAATMARGAGLAVSAPDVAWK